MEKKVDDTDHAQSIFHDYLKVGVSVDSVTRIGIHKTRLLKIDVPSEKLKKLVLCSSSKLHRDSNHAWVKKFLLHQT